jgi:DNA/RNA-binding domain of Phe-tRNA-synthetase-like protein
MNRFAYDPTITGRYPDLATSIVTVGSADNTSTRAGLALELAAEVAAVRRRHDGAALSELASIAAWRRVFTSFGTKPTQYRNAAEALIRRVVNGNDLPSLNTLTDIGNLVSIRHAVPVAVLDIAGVDGTITVRFADGTEQFHGVSTGDATTADPGEVIFVDDTGVVHARRWCWRQSRAAASGPTTTDAIFIIEAHHAQARSAVDTAASDVIALLGLYQPAAQALVHQLP